MSTLFTGFKGKSNTSFQLVRGLNSNTSLLTNSFSGAEKDIRSLTEKYDTVYMFGLDKNLDREVRIENCACFAYDTIYTEFDTQALSAQMTAHQIKHCISIPPKSHPTGWLQSVKKPLAREHLCFPRGEAVKNDRNGHF